MNTRSISTCQAAVQQSRDALIRSSRGHVHMYTVHEPADYTEVQCGQQRNEKHGKLGKTPLRGHNAQINSLS